MTANIAGVELRAMVLEALLPFARAEKQQAITRQDSDDYLALIGKILESTEKAKDGLEKTRIMFDPGDSRDMRLWFKFRKTACLAAAELNFAEQLNEFAGQQLCGQRG